MASIIVVATSAPSHVGPLLQIAVGLRDHGHAVTLMTGASFADQAAAAGIGFHPLPEAAPYDGEIFGEQRARLSDVDRLEFDLTHGFADVIPAQRAALQDLLRSEDDVLVHDCFFLGAWPVLLGATGIRPARSIAIGITPLPVSIPIAARNAEFHRMLGAGMLNFGYPDHPETACLQAVLQSHLERILAGCGVTAAVPAVFEGVVTVPDRFAQLTVPEFEFPFPSSPPGLQFVGPLPSPVVAADRQPAWLDELDGSRPTVIVTQGTVANQDLSQLVMPTLEALAGLDLTVVAALGRDPSALGNVPANARVVEFVPFGAILPHATALITNGGFGGTQQALAAGVPVIASGRTEDKPAVAARLVACGAGIDLDGDNAPERIAGALSTIRTEPHYRRAAQAMARLMAGTKAIDTIAAMAAGHKRQHGLTTARPDDRTA